MSEVIAFTGITSLNLDPDITLEGLKGKLAGFVIMGYGKDDGEEFFASTYSDGGDVLWLIERLKKQLLEVGDD